MLPDNCFCCSGKPYLSRELKEDVYDSIALVCAVVGCVFGVMQNVLVDSGVAVAVCLALMTTVSFAVGKSIPPTRPHQVSDPEYLLDDEDEEAAEA